MDDDDPATRQLRFEDGRLVSPPTAGLDPDHTTDPIEPGDRTGFSVEAKPGAITVNDSLEETIEDHGRTLEFGSRSHAEAYADQLSATGGDLRIQAAPDNDPTDVDAYLLADHSPSLTDPATVDGDTWTFDVGANLYGALGEAILLDAPRPHALHYFVRQDLEEVGIEDRLHIDIESGPLITIGGDADEDRTTWHPDCVVVVTDGWDGPEVERYYCEIKTGSASFERSQLATMQQLATEKRVLKIRMLIEALPDQYSLRITEVASPE